MNKEQTMTTATLATVLKPYFQLTNSGPHCSTARSARLRRRRFEMGLATKAEPEPLRQLADAA